MVYGTIAVDGSLVQTYIFRCVLVSRLFIYRFHRNIPSRKDFICKNVTTITMRKCQQRVTSSTYAT